jgi:hypothetical protein
MHQHQTSLTSPSDKDNLPEQTISRGIQLTDEETKYAIENLYNTSIVTKFPKVDRLYADSIYNNQIYALMSFVPSKGATPDSHGCFGFSKIRGTFTTKEEANQRAEDIIRYTDSYHSIFCLYVGRPFPICSNTDKYTKETKDIDIRKKATEVISEDINKKRQEEKKEVDDIKEREQKLLDESKDDYVQDGLDKYTQLQVKKANLVYTYLQTQKKLREMQVHIKKSYKEIYDMNIDNPTYIDLYKEKYMAARRAVNLPETYSENEDTSSAWMKYLMEDAILDFDVQN